MRLSLRGLAGPSQKGKRLDDGEGMLGVERRLQQLMQITLGLYRARTRLPLLTRDAVPARWPSVGVASLAGVQLGLWWLIATEAIPHEWATQHLVASLERPWTLVTSTFAHADFGHVIGNTVALSVFGWRLWRSIGGVAVWSLVAVGGAAAQTVVALTVPCGGIGASGGVLALAAASSVLLRKDAVKVGALGAVTLPFAAALFAATDAVSITRGLAPPHWAHLAGAACGLLFVVLRRRWLFWRGQGHGGMLAERHVSIGRVLNTPEVEEWRQLDLSFARSNRGTWDLAKFRGVWDTVEWQRFGRMERLDLSGSTFNSELSLAVLPPSLRELRVEHAAVVLGGSVASLPLLRVLRLSGRRAELAESFDWQAAVGQLESLLVVLPHSETVVRATASERLREVAVDGVALVLRVPHRGQLTALHLGLGARLESRHHDREPMEALLSFGAASPLLMPQVPALRCVDVYLDLEHWTGHPFPDLAHLFPSLSSLTLQNVPKDMAVTVPLSVSSLRLIDCSGVRAPVRPGLTVDVETAAPNSLYT